MAVPLRIIETMINKGKIRNAWIAKVIFTHLMLPSSLLVWGEDPPSPFERAQNNVAAKAPVEEAPTRLDKIKFTGFLILGEEMTVSLYDTESKQSIWVPLDGDEEGITVNEFNEVDGTISVSLLGKTREIAINENEIIAINRSEPVRTAVAKAPVAKKKPERIKDPEILKKEEEARLFVSDLLASSMLQREKYRREREARLDEAKNN